MRSRELGGCNVRLRAEILWKGGRGLSSLRMASRRSDARCSSVGQCSSVGRGLRSWHRILGRSDGRRIRRQLGICARGPGSSRRTGNGRIVNPCTGSGRIANRCSGSRWDIAGGHRRRGHGRAFRMGRRCSGSRRKSSRRTGSGCMRGRRFSRRRNGPPVGTLRPGSTCGIVGRRGVRSLRIRGFGHEGRGRRVGCNRRSGRIRGHGHGRIRKLAPSRIGELGRSRIRGPARHRRRGLGRSCANGPGRRRLGGPSHGCISGPGLGHSRNLGRSRMRGPG